MDINTLRSLSTVLVMIAFAGVCWWAFSPSRKKKFEDAANSVFDDDNNIQKAESISVIKPEAVSGEERQEKS